MHNNSAYISLQSAHDNPVSWACVFPPIVSTQDMWKHRSKVSMRNNKYPLVLSLSFSPSAKHSYQQNFFFWSTCSNLILAQGSTISFVCLFTEEEAKNGSSTYLKLRLSLMIYVCKQLLLPYQGLI